MLMKVTIDVLQVRSHLWRKRDSISLCKGSNQNWKFGQGLRRTKPKLRFNGTLSKKNSKIFLPWWCTSRSCGPRGCPSSPCRRRWRRRRCWWGRGRSRCWSRFVSLRSKLKKLLRFVSNLTWFLNKIKEKKPIHG